MTEEERRKRVEVSVRTPQVDQNQIRVLNDKATRSEFILWPLREHLPILNHNSSLV